MNTDLTTLLEAAPQLAAIIVLYIWHTRSEETREREQTLIIKTLSRLTLTALESAKPKPKQEETHG